MANFTFPDYSDFSHRIAGSEQQLELLPLFPVNVPYMLSEIIVAVLAVVGNALTLFVFGTDRKLRRLTNYYIASLALADLLVGVLGVPFAILTSLGLPRPLWACLLMLSSLMILCTISIFCLVAVSVDRYWAILYPLVYSRVMTGKIARRIIFVCWCAGTIIGLLPVFGWHLNYQGLCFFVKIMDYDYLVFLYFLTIVGPGIIMAVFYAHIYSVVLKQLRQIAAQEVTPDPEKTISPATPKKVLLSKLSSRQRFSIKLRNIGSLRESFRGVSLSKKKNDVEEREIPGQISRGAFSTASSSMIAPQGSEYNRRDSGISLVGPQLSRPSRREVKAAKNLSIIVLFFFICWFPLYTINCVQAFCTTCPVPAELMFFTIILSHANSAINPILYAYHMKDFRRGLEVHVLQRLGWRSPKSPYYGAPLSPHYSTIMHVNVTPTSTLARSHSPYLCNASSFDPSPSRSLLYPMDTSPTSLPCSGLLDERTLKEQTKRDSFLEFPKLQKIPLNTTSSWPPSLFSRMLLSPNLLSNESSSRSRKRKIRKFLSLDITSHFQGDFSVSSSLIENHGSSSGTINDKLASLGSLDSSCVNEQRKREYLKRHRRSFSEPTSPSQSRLLVLSSESPKIPSLSTSDSSSTSMNLIKIGGEAHVHKPKSLISMEEESDAVPVHSQKHRSKSYSGYEKDTSDEKCHPTSVCVAMPSPDLKATILDKSNKNFGDLLFWNLNHKLSKSTNNISFDKHSSQFTVNARFKNLFLNQNNDDIICLNNSFAYVAVMLSTEELQKTPSENVSQLTEFARLDQNSVIPVSSLRTRKYSERKLNSAKHLESKRTLSDST